MGPGGLGAELAATAAGTAVAGHPRSSDGRVVLDGRDRRPGLACAAVGRAAVMERVLRAAGTVLGREALRDHRRTPGWPDGYLELRARQAAEALAAAREGVSGIGGPLGAFADAEPVPQRPGADRVPSGAGRSTPTEPIDTAARL